MRSKLKSASSRRVSVLLLPLIGGLLGACASSRPGTGDVSYRLLWEGDADLDLHVVDPEQRHVGFSRSLRLPQLRRTGGLAAVPRVLGAERGTSSLLSLVATEAPSQSKAVGILDIDCNGNVECKRPMENIFWPEGEAPRGLFLVWIELFQPLSSDTSTVAFTVEVRRGPRVVEVLEGLLDNSTRFSPLYEDRFAPP